MNEKRTPAVHLTGCGKQGPISVRCWTGESRTRNLTNHLTGVQARPGPGMRLPARA